MFGGVFGCDAILEQSGCLGYWGNAIKSVHLSAGRDFRKFSAGIGFMGFHLVFLNLFRMLSTTIPGVLILLSAIVG